MKSRRNNFILKNSIHKSKKLKAPFPHLGLLQVHISVSNYLLLLHFNIQLFNQYNGSPMRLFISYEFLNKYLGCPYLGHPNFSISSVLLIGYVLLVIMQEHLFCAYRYDYIECMFGCQGKILPATVFNFDGWLKVLLKKAIY